MGMMEDLMDNENDEDTGERALFTFALNNEIFAIDLLSMKEITCMTKITPLPGSQKHIKGIINLRDKIVPVMDIRLRINMEEKSHDDRTCIVVVTSKEVPLMGLIVDEVREVVKVQADTIKSHSLGIQDNYVEGMYQTGDSLVAVLSLTHLLSGPEEVHETNEYSEELRIIKRITAAIKDSTEAKKAFRGVCWMSRYSYSKMGERCWEPFI